MAWDSRLPLLGQQFDTNQVFGAAEQGVRLADLGQQMAVRRDAHQATLADLARQQTRQGELSSILGNGGGIQDLVRGGFIPEATQLADVGHRQAQTTKAGADATSVFEKAQREAQQHVATAMSGADQGTWDARRQKLAQEVYSQVAAAHGEEKARAMSQQVYEQVGGYDPDKAAMFNNFVVSPADQYKTKTKREDDATDRTYKSTEAQKRDAAAKERAEILVGTKSTADAQRNTDDIRKEISSRPEIKKYRQASAELQSLKELAKTSTGANDMALVFAFMKAMDPESVVRESEYAAAEAAGKPTDRMMGLVSKYWTGGRLAPEQKAAMIKAAEAAQSGHKNAYKKAVDTYRTVAKNRSLKLSELGIEYDKAGPHGPTVEQDGKVFTWNPETGEYE